MNERELAQLHRLRALETTPDRPPEAPWQPSDSAAVTEVARRRVGESASAEAFMQARAEVGLDRLRHLDAGAAEALLRPMPHGAQRRRSLWLAAVLLALVAGLTGDALISGQRVPLLSPVLVGLCGYNLLVYLVLLSRSLVATRSASGSGLHEAGWLQGWWSGQVQRGLGWMDRRPPAAALAAKATAAAAAQAQASQRQQGLAWLRRVRATAIAGSWRDGQPVLMPWLMGLLHSAAAAVAVGMLASMYARGLLLEFRAGWESTFLDAAQVRSALGLLLAPSQLLPALALPDVAGIAGLRWDVGNGAPAGPWIHRMAITLLVVVVIPRMLLAVWALVRSRLAGASLAPDPRDAWVREQARHAPVRERVVTVLPYNCRDSALASGLAAALAGLLGPGSVARVAPVLPLGAEDDLPAGLPDPITPPVVVLMDLAATPERETHGAFLTRLAGLLPPGSEHRLLLDSGGMVARLGVQPDATDRLAGRHAAWARVAEEAGWPRPDMADLRSTPAAAGSSAPTPQRQS